MTKTLEEILTKLEKDFSELKQYALKLEAENCMLREELDKKDEDIPDNCAIIFENALNSAYVKKDSRNFEKYTYRIFRCLVVSGIIPRNSYLGLFHGKKLSNYICDIRGLDSIAIFAVILIHYGINIKIDIDSFEEEFITSFNEKFEYWF